MLASLGTWGRLSSIRNVVYKHVSPPQTDVDGQSTQTETHEIRSFSICSRSVPHLVGKKDAEMYLCHISLTLKNREGVCQAHSNLGYKDLCQCCLHRLQRIYRVPK